MFFIFFVALLGTAGVTSVWQGCVATGRATTKNTRSHPAFFYMITILEGLSRCKHFHRRLPDAE